MDANTAHKSEGVEDIFCDCEKKSEYDRIKCLVDSFRDLMIARGRPLSQVRYESLLNSRRLARIELVNIEVGSIIEQITESQIIYTFLQGYNKRHPRFRSEGPSADEYKSKANFFSSI